MLQTDDIDFNEVFADYFINEFDDPINAYTNSMANYATGTFHMTDATGSPSMGVLPSPAPVSAAGASPAPTGLPTGGIRTVFHTGAAPAALPNHAAAPAAKKAKIAPRSSGISHNVAGLPANPPVAAPVQQQQQPLAPAPAATSGVALPVGVGIKLGGIGGIAPATAQSSARVPGVQAQYSMWGGAVVDGGASDKVVAERRQRNREHAKRSRVRKKFMLESLQGQVRQLQKENQTLRMIVQEHIPEHSMKIIADCCTQNPLFNDPDAEAAEKKPEALAKNDELERQDFSLIRSLASGQKCFVLSDPKLPDNPIIFASEGFYQLTGYTSKEVLGRNCRFLQGPGTDKKAVDVIRKAVSSGSDATVCLLNYKADGTPFWNQFFIAALRDSDNCIVNYVSLRRSCDRLRFAVVVSHTFSYACSSGRSTN